MYSMVLMAALTTATDMPDFGHRGWGCCGCYGGYGWGCCGCYGGYGWGGWGGYGGYGWGGWGGGYGGWGGWGGGYGGWGGGYGGWGRYGGWGYVSAPTVSAYATPMMVASNTLPATNAVTRSMYYSPSTSANRRATIIVHVPKNATLMVDGKPTKSTSSTRRFYSPPLESGKSYHYKFVARMDRDGQTVTADKRVEVQAGVTREITITQADLEQTVERQRPTRLPAEEKGLPKKQTKVVPK